MGIFSSIRNYFSKTKPTLSTSSFSYSPLRTPSSNSSTSLPKRFVDYGTSPNTSTNQGPVYNSPSTINSSRSRSSRNKSVSSSNLPSRFVDYNPEPNTSTAQGPVYSPPNSAPLPNTNRELPTLFTDYGTEPNFSTPEGPVYIPPPEQNQEQNIQQPLDNISQSINGQEQIVSQEQQSIPYTFTGGQGVYAPASSSERFAMNSITGPFSQYFNALFNPEPDPSGRDIQTLPTAAVLGKLTNYVTTLQAVGGIEGTYNAMKNVVTNLPKAIDGVYNVLNDMKAIGTLALAGDIRTIAETGTTLESLGIKVLEIAPKTGSNIISSEQAYNALNGAKIASNTKNAQRLFGGTINFMKGVGIKRAVTIGGILYIIKSSLTTAGFVQTDINNFAQSVSFHVGELKEAGMNEQADKIMQEVKDLSDGFDKIVPFIPFIGQYIIGSKITKYQTDLNNIINDYNDAKVADLEFNVGIEDMINRGESVSQADLEKAARINPYGAAAKILESQIVANSQLDEINKQNSILSRMYGMNNIQIISDPEIVAFANDPNNQYSTVTRLYNQAILAYIESTNPDNYFGENYMNSGLPGQLYNQQFNQQNNQGVFEPPSSLNFGLLRTPSGYRQANRDEQNINGEFVTDVNEIAQYYFGIPYSQLTEQQQQLVDSISNG